MSSRPAPQLLTAHPNHRASPSFFLALLSIQTLSCSIPRPTIPPDSYIDVGMTAYAKNNSDQVIIKITKVERKHDVEGTIINIISEPKGKPKTDLSVGDRVFINRLDIEVLLR